MRNYQRVNCIFWRSNGHNEFGCHCPKRKRFFLFATTCKRHVFGVVSPQIACEHQLVRKSGLPYIVHPIEVMSIIKKHKESRNEAVLLIAALGHDWFEDTEADEAEARAEFGDMAVSIMLELTNDEAEIERLGKEEYKKQEFLRLSNYALAIRLADNVANCSDSPESKMMMRIGRCAQFLIKNRTLTGSQQRIFNDLKTLFADYGYDLENDDLSD